MAQRTDSNGLTVGDGFKFGCGFILAGIIFSIVVFAIFAVIAIASTFLGINFAQFFP